jgi:hypothetical protein
LNPWDFEEFLAKSQYVKGYQRDSIYYDWSAGEVTIHDFRKRLTNALTDASLPNHNVEKFLAWFKRALQYQHCGGHQGAVSIYRINRT